MAIGSYLVNYFLDMNLAEDIKNSGFLSNISSSLLNTKDLSSIDSNGIVGAFVTFYWVGAMIGGFIVSDCLGFGSEPHDKAPRIMTTVALLTGMVVAVCVLQLKFDIAPTIIAAQAVTVVGAPLIAAVLLWLASSKDVMGTHAARPATLIFAGVGLAVLIAIAANTAINTVPTKIRNYLNKNTEENTEKQPPVADAPSPAGPTTD